MKRRSQHASIKSCSSQVLQSFVSTLGKQKAAKPIKTPLSCVVLSPKSQLCMAIWWREHGIVRVFLAISSGVRWRWRGKKGVEGGEKKSKREEKGKREDWRGKGRRRVEGEGKEGLKGKEGVEGVKGRERRGRGGKRRGEMGRRAWRTGERRGWRGGNEGVKGGRRGKPLSFILFSPLLRHITQCRYTKQTCHYMWAHQNWKEKKSRLQGKQRQLFSRLFAPLLFRSTTWNWRENSGPATHERTPFSHSFWPATRNKTTYFKENVLRCQKLAKGVGVPKVVKCRVEQILTDKDKKNNNNNHDWVLRASFVLL